VLAETESPLVWNRMHEAEVRSLYFGEQAVRYTKLKQIITGTSFFLSSGAAATLIASFPKWIPTVLSTIVAILTAYSIAVSLDKRIGTICKLHAEWNHLCSQYEHLWHHRQEDDAEEIFAELGKRGREASQIATELPYHPDALQKWEKLVYSRLVKETR
jgi:hypothetical protein